MKHISKTTDIPTGESFCAIKSTTVYTPGDERSRTNPGHGYPESWDPAIEMISFATPVDLSAWASKNLSELPKYRFFKMLPLVLQPDIKISVTPATR